MKKNEPFPNFLKERVTKEKEPITYSQGITERLLAKYKPEKGLSVINGGKNDIEKGLAA